MNQSAPARVDQRRGVSYGGGQQPNQNRTSALERLRQDSGPREIRQAPTEEVLYELMAENNWLNLSPELRLAGYKARCDAIGLDPMTFPFEFIEFKTGKVTLYPTRAATDQLRRIYGVSVKITGEGFDRDTQTLWAKAEATFPDGRTDEDVAYLFAGTTGGLELANLKMKVITKVKRRVTLSAIGLGQMAEAGDDYDEGRYIRKHDIDLTAGKIGSGEPAPDANIYRRLHGMIGKRLPQGEEAHGNLRNLAAELFDQFGSLKLLGDERYHRLAAFITDAPDDEFFATIDRGAAKLAARQPGNAPESRQTRETPANEPVAVDDTNDASADAVEADDAIFADLNDGDDDADPVPDVDPDTGEIMDGHENTVYNWIAAVEETSTKRQLDAVAKQIADSGIEDSRIDVALDSKYSQAEKVTGRTRPVFGETLPPEGEAGHNRHTN